MSFTFKKLVPGDYLKKAEYFDSMDFSWVQRSQKLDVPVAQKWEQQSYFLPSRHEDSVDEIENFSVRPEDVWILGFPKTGTTWTQEMVWQICNNLNYEKGKSIELYERSPFLEWGTIFTFKNTTQSIDHIENLASPRVIKCHLAAPLVPKGIWTVKPKVIYCARNIKDTAISFFHLYKNVFGYKDTLEKFLDAFLEDNVIYTPLDAHINDFWNMRNEDNIFFLTYEEMKKDLPGIIRKIAAFLEKSLSEEQVQKLTEHLSFGKMASNESVNFNGRLENFSSLTNADRDVNFTFMRKGKIGSFNEEMPKDVIEKFNIWIKKRNEEYKRDPKLLDVLLE